MVSILISQDGDSERFATALFNMIRQNGSTILLSETVSLFEDNPEFCLTVCPPNKRIVVAPALPCIVFVADTGKPNFDIPVGASVLSFAESGNGMALDGSQQLISCGLRQRDTLTLSSLDSKKPVFSVQRTIYTLHGEKLEIGEYPLMINEDYNPRDIIAAAAVVILYKGSILPNAFATHSRDS